MPLTEELLPLGCNFLCPRRLWPLDTTCPCVKSVSGQLRQSYFCNIVPKRLPISAKFCQQQSFLVFTFLKLHFCSQKNNFRLEKFSEGLLPLTKLSSPLGRKFLRPRHSSDFLSITCSCVKSLSSQLRPSYFCNLLLQNKGCLPGLGNNTAFLFLLFLSVTRNPPGNALVLLD